MNARGPQSSQSLPSGQIENSEPGPLSSQSLSEAYMHVLPHPGVCGSGGGAGGNGTRTPQSWQSLPCGQMAYSAPGPPSSQSPSDECTHSSLHPGVHGDGGGNGGSAGRTPQSLQSVP